MDPVGAFRFIVEIDGLQVGGFSEVTGLDVEIETEQIKEGGLNYTSHNLPKKVKYNKLILKRGVSQGDVLLDWFKQCVMGSVQRKNGAVILQDIEKNRVRTWSFYAAYPVKFSGPQLNAKGTEVAIESIELMFEEMHSS